MQKSSFQSAELFKHNVVTKCISIAVCTRNRNWNNEEYQKGVIEPYRRITDLQADLIQKNKQPSIKQMQVALDMLQSVFITKKVPVREQCDRYEDLFAVTGTRQLFPDFKMPVAD